MGTYRGSSAKRRRLPHIKKNFGLPGDSAGRILYISEKERQRIWLKGILVILMLNYFFYRSFPAFVPLCGVGFLFCRLQKEEIWRKKREEARDQFKELLVLTSTALKGGYSAENAFLSAYEDMKILYGSDSSVCRMLQVLKTGRENNRDFCGLWKQMGESTGIAEICEFAEVYAISQQKSGNVSSVMDKTVEIIIQKIETEKEIEVLLSARKLEQRIMNSMPFLIMLYIHLTSPGYFDGLYHTTAGVLIMSLCLGIYLAAYLLSVKFVSIQV